MTFRQFKEKIVSKINKIDGYANVYSLFNNTCSIYFRVQGCMSHYITVREDGQQVVIEYQHCNSSIVIPIKDHSEFEAFCNEVDEEAKKSHKRDYLKFINS